MPPAQPPSGPSGPPPGPVNEPGPLPPLPKYGEVPLPRSGPTVPGLSEQPYYGYPSHEPPQNQKTSTLAVLALVFGAVGAIPVGIVLGIIALTRIPSTREKGKGLAIGGIATACAWVVVLALIGAGAGSEPTRNVAGQVTAPVAVPYQKLRVGDCVAGVDEGAVRDLELRPCSGPNGGRVYAVFDLPVRPYPGPTATQTTAGERCAERWADQGGKLTDPTEVFTLFPSNASWKRGDHRVTCLLTPR
ncbi:DUF4190 domain-containing protein [Kribbella lupini]|uniref:DUF4190 domain-containing protein n=1 Tax=Kribbella lupini TaxID=291602 RepID=A0ABN2BTA2_9ACTN